MKLLKDDGRNGTYLPTADVLSRSGWTRLRIARLLVEPDRIERIYTGYGQASTSYFYNLESVVLAETRFAEDAALCKAARSEAAKRAAKTRRIRHEQGLPTIKEEKRLAEVEAVAHKKAEDDFIGRGLRKYGYPHPRHDGYRQFTFEEMYPFIVLRDAVAREGLSQESIAEFYRLWRSASGYCNPLGTLKKFITEIKDHIIFETLSQAKASGWDFGNARDDKGKVVLYIDTPYGQCSWHVLAAMSGRKYEKPWSGVRETDAILRRLFETKTFVVG